MKRLDFRFLSVQDKPVFLALLFDFLHAVFQIFFVLMYQIEVIHISSVVFDVQLFLYEVVKRVCNHQRVYLRHLTAKPETDISEILHELAGNTAHILVMYPTLRLSVNDGVRRTVEEIRKIACKNTTGFYAFNAKHSVKSVQVSVQPVHSEVYALTLQACGVIKNK